MEDPKFLMNQRLRPQAAASSAKDLFSSVNGIDEPEPEPELEFELTGPGVDREPDQIFFWQSLSVPLQRSIMKQSTVEM